VGPIFDGDGSIRGGDVVEPVFLVPSPDADVDRLADGGNLEIALEKAGKFHRALPPAAQVDEGGVGSDRQHHAGDASARVERHFGPQGRR